jgi:hypothetical protein
LPGVNSRFPVPLWRHPSSGGILKKHYLAALNTIISYGAMVNDFEFIQPFGGNHVPIDEGRKSQKEIPSNLNMVTIIIIKRLITIDFNSYIYWYI